MPASTSGLSANLLCTAAASVPGRLSDACGWWEGLACVPVLPPASRAPLAPHSDVQVVESIFKLQEAQPASVAADMRNALLDQLA